MAAFISANKFLQRKTSGVHTCTEFARTWIFGQHVRLLFRLVRVRIIFTSHLVAYSREIEGSHYSVSADFPASQETVDKLFPKNLEHNADAREVCRDFLNCLKNKGNYPEISDEEYVEKHFIVKWRRNLE